jgi:hypothetical protein
MKRRPDSTMYRGDVKRSTAGRRTVRLSQSVVDALRSHKARQAALRVISGPRWEDHELVFCGTDPAGPGQSPQGRRPGGATGGHRRGLPESKPAGSEPQTLRSEIEGVPASPVAVVACDGGDLGAWRLPTPSETGLQPNGWVPSGDWYSHQLVLAFLGGERGRRRDSRGWRPTQAGYPLCA